MPKPSPGVRSALVMGVVFLLAWIVATCSAS
jgi:hypothetical protein